jgi:2-succinyl-5-enolpyruvyl-6-hydroxy-3-cyclohexene-1-carboxylate synthase
MNRNIVFAELLVDELVRAGLTHVCISPGSRNTPLVLAFAQHPSLKVTSHLDERSAAFFALGIGMATGMPAAVLCTSGSALANYFPAVVEAHQSRVPMLILSADRPHELRNSGANQTVDQVKLYGDFAVWSVDMPLPEAQPSALFVRQLRTLAGRVIAVARGMAEGMRAGVVHLNVPFRPPLEATRVATDALEAPADAKPRAGAYTRTVVADTPIADAGQVEALVALIEANPRGVLVCGPDTRATRERDVFGPALQRLAARAGYPIFADGLSGLRLPGSISAADTLLNAASGVAPAFPAPDLVLRIGSVPTSKWLNQFLDQAAPETVIHLSSDGVWADDSHRVSHHFVTAHRAALLNAVAEMLQPRNMWTHTFADAQSAAVAALIEDDWFDAVAVHDVWRALPPEASLFVGNSLAVRHLDQFADPRPRPPSVFGNRGASGIDGNISTALGIGHARPDAPLTLIVGDVTLYHDMNGLLAIKRCNVPVTLVVLNNGGGGIFERLPVKQATDAEIFEQHFLTPHQLDMGHVAALYGLRHMVADTRLAFNVAYSNSLRSRESVLIEVRTQAEQDLRLRGAVMRRAMAQVSQV